MIVIDNETKKKMINALFGMWLSNDFGERREIEKMQQQVIDEISDRYNLHEQEKDFVELEVMQAVGMSEYNAFRDGVILGLIIAHGYMF